MPALARLALSALAAASVASAASRTTWQQEGKIKNPYAECAAYGLPAVDGELVVFKARGGGVWREGACYFGRAAKLNPALVARLDHTDRPTAPRTARLHHLFALVTNLSHTNPSHAMQPSLATTRPTGRRPRSSTRARSRPTSPSSPR